MATILVIDDNLKFRSMVCSCLAKLGHTILEAQDGDSGLSIFNEHKPDLVITDIIMPERDGASLIFELQKKIDTSKIIVMTGSSQNYLNSIAELSGTKYNFIKPFDLNKLLDAVKEILG